MTDGTPGPAGAGRGFGVTPGLAAVVEQLAQKSRDFDDAQDAFTGIKPRELGEPVVDQNWTLFSGRLQAELNVTALAMKQAASNAAVCLASYGQASSAAIALIASLDWALAGPTP